MIGETRNASRPDQPSCAPFRFHRPGLAESVRIGPARNISDLFRDSRAVGCSAATILPTAFFPLEVVHAVAVHAIVIVPACRVGFDAAKQAQRSSCLVLTDFFFLSRDSRVFDFEPQ